MIIVLICFLFFSSVAFGQLPRPQTDPPLSKINPLLKLISLSSTQTDPSSNQINPPLNLTNPSSTQTSYGNIAGTIFYSDGKTPLVLSVGSLLDLSSNESSVANVIVGSDGLFRSHVDGVNVGKALIDSSGHYSFTNVLTSKNPYQIRLFNETYGISYSQVFNVTSEGTTIVNVTTLRMSTN